MILAQIVRIRSPYAWRVMSERSRRQFKYFFFAVPIVAIVLVALIPSAPSMNVTPKLKSDSTSTAAK